jgi:hypothetical protein
MRKGEKDGKAGRLLFNVSTLDRLQKAGYRFVQVKGLTIDKHYEYVDPYFLILLPCKELPTDPSKRDIYEPIKSELLYKWATEKNEFPQIVIAEGYLN